MPTFDFQLEGVLRHRRNIEHERQRQLALVQLQMQQLEVELRQLDQTVQDVGNELRQSRLVGRLDMGFLAGHRRYIASMQRKAMGIVQRMALVQRQMDEARTSLGEAAKQRKVIEKLREKQYARWTQEIYKREISELDEIGMQLSYRQLAAEALGEEAEGVA